ncbi:hypothetical protein BDV38DRAFT_271473 [Aspergillus pseudotamarii]|uniref:NmrA-like domain-containing protein n=1 Tax=Aspergillus pseudotamarii TaxID=132259 RepID=A0A5N6SUA8_ASPPS|nr:uncharacterized protein BDV38DRAFT_271473 [Aspergillus pseudotamarii]KAE8137371.1 hypothetical protein BDV38DRAFT_271473 [Aspergillus pseudotamarii]
MQSQLLCEPVNRRDHSLEELRVSRSAQTGKEEYGRLEHGLASCLKKACSRQGLLRCEPALLEESIGNNAEETQGKSLIDEALKQNVKFFVYCSVDRGGEDHSYTNPTKIPHFIKKHNIEHHLVDRSKNTSMEWTILRPTAFYENLTPDFFGKVFATCFKMALKGKKLQMYKGRGVSLAGDELSFEEMERVFMQTRRESLSIAFRPVCSLFMAMGYMALKEVHPDMKDFGTWLEMESGFVKR